ncbi:hypothetical protein ACQKOM_09830 [Peribacillus frigoritolerans]
MIKGSSVSSLLVSFAGLLVNSTVLLVSFADLLVNSAVLLVNWPLDS